MPDPESLDASIAFLETLSATPPDAPTACAEWTAHELVAHLAAGAAEMADLVEDRLAGRPMRATRGFTEREAPYRALPDEELRGRLITQAIRLAQAVDELEDAAAAGVGGAGGAVTFTGRDMDPAQLRRHGRSEAALHRWDLAGSDETSLALLADPELTVHAVGLLNEMSALDESLSQRARRSGVAVPEGFSARLSSPGQADVVLRQVGGGLRLGVEPSGSDGPAMVCDPATRLLLLWGRRSPDAQVETSLQRSDQDIIEAALLA